MQLFIIRKSVYLFAQTNEKIKVIFPIQINYCIYFKLVFEKVVVLYILLLII